MKIYNEIGLRDFKAWSGATNVKDKIIDEGKENEFNELMEERYPQGLTEEGLNDILNHEDDWIYSVLLIHNSDDEDEDDEEDEDEL